MRKTIAAAVLAVLVGCGFEPNVEGRHEVAAISLPAQQCDPVEGCPGGDEPEDPAPTGVVSLRLVNWTGRQASFYVEAGGTTASQPFTAYVHLPAGGFQDFPSALVAPVGSSVPARFLVKPEALTRADVYTNLYVGGASVGFHVIAREVDWVTTVSVEQPAL